MTQRPSAAGPGRGGRRPYDLSNLARTTFRFVPDLVEHANAISASMVGEQRMPVDARMALHLRLARVLRCPVCLLAFPALARVAGLTGPEIDAALDGRTDRLRPTVAQTVAWAGAVARAGGEMPLDWPPEARAMTMRQREQVLLLTRLELVVHAMGLLVVPEPLLGAPEPVANP